MIPASFIDIKLHRRITGKAFIEYATDVIKKMSCSDWLKTPDRLRQAECVYITRVDPLWNYIDNERTHAVSKSFMYEQIDDVLTLDDGMVIIIRPTRSYMMVTDDANYHIAQGIEYVYQGYHYILYYKDALTSYSVLKKLANRFIDVIIQLNKDFKDHA